MNDALRRPAFPTDRRALPTQKACSAFVIGGYVRDHFLHRPCTDIDIVVVGSGIEVAEALGRELKTKVSVFKNFGTAMLRCDGMGSRVRRGTQGVLPGRLAQTDRRGRNDRRRPAPARLHDQRAWHSRSMPARSANWSIRSTECATSRTTSSARRATATPPFQTIRYA